MHHLGVSSNQNSHPIVRFSKLIKDIAQVDLSAPPYDKQKRVELVVLCAGDGMILLTSVFLISGFPPQYLPANAFACFCVLQTRKKRQRSRTDRRRKTSPVCASASAS